MRKQQWKNGRNTGHGLNLQRIRTRIKELDKWFSIRGEAESLFGDSVF
jgi:hypothetical protein